MDDLQRQSPLHGYEPFTQQGIELRELALHGKVRIQALRARGSLPPAADPSKLPGVPDEAIGEDPIALWSAPDDWLVYSKSLSAHAIRDWAEAISSDAPLVVTDVSSGTTVLELRGDRVVGILLRDCTLDLEGDAVPPGTCAQTSFAQIPIMLHRPDPDTWRIFVERSTASHIWDWLVDSAGASSGSTL